MSDQDCHITPIIANHVLYFFDGGGYPADDFFDDLMSLIERASIGDRELLRKSYPGYVQAMTIMQSRADGVKVLRDLIKRPPPCAKCGSEPPITPRMRFCAACIDQCRESELAHHRCAVCA